MSKLTSLREVDASTNQLTSFPVSLCQLKNLDSLNLSHNKITSVPSDVASLNVVELNLNQNRVGLVISCRYLCNVGVLVLFWKSGLMLQSTLLFSNVIKLPY